MTLPRYQRYKQSGVQWLGPVPSEWDIVPGRRLFAQTRRPALGSDRQLSATQKYGVIPQDEFMAREDQKVALALKGTDGFRHVDTGDFVISLRSFEGGIEACAYDGCVSPAYAVLKPRNFVHTEFWKYLFKSRPYVSALQSATDGIRDGKTISYDQFGRIDLPCSSFSEQTEIVYFLDREAAKIDALIGEQQRLIELLKEKRQAVISHAVTKGLNPEAPMKDSGMNWLGSVPAHWTVLKAKRVADIFVPQRDKPELNSEKRGFPWVTMEQMKEERISTSSLWVSEEAMREAGTRVLKSGAVIASCVGTFGIASINSIDIVINQQLQAFVPKGKVLPEYLRHSVASAKSYFEQIGTAATLTYVNQQGFEGLPLALPPKEEQHLIVDHVREAILAIDELLQQAGTVVALLQERRTALISAAVTGKIDVRQSVAEVVA